MAQLAEQGRTLIVADAGLKALSARLMRALARFLGRGAGVLFARHEFSALVAHLYIAVCVVGAPCVAATPRFGEAFGTPTRHAAVIAVGRRPTRLALALAVLALVGEAVSHGSQVLFTSHAARACRAAQSGWVFVAHGGVMRWDFFVGMTLLLRWDFPAGLALLLRWDFSVGLALLSALLLRMVCHLGERGTEAKQPCCRSPARRRVANLFQLLMVLSCRSIQGQQGGLIFCSGTPMHYKFKNPAPIVRGKQGARVRSIRKTVGGRRAFHRIERVQFSQGSRRDPKH